LTDRYKISTFGLKIIYIEGGSSEKSRLSFFMQGIREGFLSSSWVQLQEEKEIAWPSIQEERTTLHGKASKELMDSRERTMPVMST